MKLLVFIAFFFHLLPLSAQVDNANVKKDTVFYKGENGFIVSTIERDKAEGFSFATDYNPNSYVKKIWYLQSDKIMAEYGCYDKSYVNEKTHSSSVIPFKNGRYMEYYQNGEQKVSCFYTDDKLNGNFKVFYPNGKPKRIENWKDGEWQQGVCFDETGNKIPYCSYQELPEFKGGLPKLFEFLGNQIKYPESAQREGIEGTVYVGFSVETDGSLSDIRIVREVETSLDKEAMRIVKKLPKWKPGRFEGELVRYKFTLPIKFKLE